MRKPNTAIDYSTNFTWNFDEKRTNYRSESDIKLTVRAKSDSWRLARPIRNIGVLLVPNFALMSFACAVEPFRAANRVSGREIYRWQHISPDGGPVHASNGVQIVPEFGVGAPAKFDLLIVCAGGNPADFRDARTFAWLRRIARDDTPIAGVSGGSYVMARAGVLEGYRFTIHWEHIPAFIEEFPNHQLTRSLYEIDRERLSCAGGTASLDMMTALIEREHGAELAGDVAEQFLHTHLRASDESQRMPVRERLAVSHPRLVRIIERMEANLEDPVPRVALARMAGLSVRQVERLFHCHLGRSIAAHYRELRLRRARTLLVQSTMSILEIAVACGFVSASHFARRYRARYGVAPRTDRKRGVSQTDK